MKNLPTLEKHPDTMEGEIDYKKMVKEIDVLVETDFCCDMECHALEHSKPFTQDEARKMSEIISSIYSIAHCIDCEACQGKYKLTKPL